MCLKALISWRQVHQYKKVVGELTLGRGADRGRKNTEREGCLRCKMPGIAGVSKHRNSDCDQNWIKINDNLSMSCEDIKEKYG